MVLFPCTVVAFHKITILASTLVWFVSAGCGIVFQKKKLFYRCVKVVVLVPIVLMFYLTCAEGSLYYIPQALLSAIL